MSQNLQNLQNHLFGIGKPANRLASGGDTVVQPPHASGVLLCFAGFVMKNDRLMIILNLDVMLAKRKVRSNDLAQRIGLTQANLSILKTGKAKAIRLTTLDAICRELQCTPGDILEYRENDEK